MKYDKNNIIEKLDSVIQEFVRVGNISRNCNNEVICNIIMTKIKINSNNYSSQPSGIVIKYKDYKIEIQIHYSHYRFFNDIKVYKNENLFYIIDRNVGMLTDMKLHTLNYIIDILENEIEDYKYNNDTELLKFNNVISNVIKGSKK